MSFVYIFPLPDPRYVLSKLRHFPIQCLDRLSVLLRIHLSLVNGLPRLHQFSIFGENACCKLNRNDERMFLTLHDFLSSFYSSV